MRDLPGFLDVTTDLQISNPEVLVEIDRDKARTLGVTADQIENTLYNAYGAKQISTIYTSTNQYRVILEVEPQYQRSPSSLSLLYVRSSGGRLIPIDAVAKLSPRVGPLTVNHTGQLPSVTLSFNLKPGVALGDAVQFPASPRPSENRKMLSDRTELANAVSTFDTDHHPTNNARLSRVPNLSTMTPEPSSAIV